MPVKPRTNRTPRQRQGAAKSRTAKLDFQLAIGRKFQEKYRETFKGLAKNR